VKQTQRFIHPPAGRCCNLAPVRRGAIVRLIAIGLVVGVICTLVAVLIPWLPDSASKQMDRIVFIYWFATVISIVIFSLVAAVLLYSVFNFRSPPEDESDGPSIHGHTGLEVAWTVVPAILVIAIGVMSAVVLSQNGNAGTNPMTIKVFAQQFAWRFVYPDEGNLKSNKLVMPLDRNITFEFESADVIHSFWIPAMGQKQDVVPGIHTSIVVTPTRTGDFTLICTELCGLGHATMRAPVTVVKQDDFDKWVDEQKQGGPAGGGSGKAVFAAQGCGSCHTFNAAGSIGKIGPNLDNIVADAQKAGEDPAAYVKESIVDPNKVIASGYQPGVMPGNFGETLSAKEIDALVAFITGKEQ
jgi:cytochrome c oxidase subunit II